jgi:hypothetical protein
MDGEQRQHLEELLHIHQQRLRVLEKQAATFGLNTPPEVQIEIRDLRRNIADIDTQLADSNKVFGQHITDIRNTGTYSNRQNVWLIFGGFGVFLLAVAIWVLNPLGDRGPNNQQQPTTLGAVVPTVVPFTLASTLTTASTPEPKPTATPEPTSIPTVPPHYDRRLPQEIDNASQDKKWPGTVHLSRDQPYKLRECEALLCYIDVWPPGEAWVKREQIGEPPATATLAKPRSPTVTPPPNLSITYRVDIQNLSSREEMKTLPGCDQPIESNNACIVGPSHLGMEVFYPDDPSKSAPFNSDSRLITVFLMRTVINVTSDGSGYDTRTIGNNNFTPEPGQHYQVVVTKLN